MYFGGKSAPRVLLPRAAAAPPEQSPDRDCSECVFRAGATPDVTVARDLEVLAYHMLYTKPWIGRKYAVAPALRDCEAFALWKSETSREHHLECVDAPR